MSAKILKDIIPISFSILIISSFMNYYVVGPLFLVLFMLTVLIQFSMFNIYNFLAKKSLILRYVSILGSFFIVCIMAYFIVKTSQNNEEIDFIVWFWSPREAINEFYFTFTFITFVVSNLFIASTVYYFSKVRYRIYVNFLLALIPFATFTKAGDELPIGFTIALLIMYFSLMVYYRQLDVSKNVAVMVDKNYKKSIAYFLTVASFAALMLPKPDIKENRSAIENIFDSSKFGNYVLESLGLLSESSDGGPTIRSNQSQNRFLFNVYSKESLNLKSKTYSLYNKGVWNLDDVDRTDFSEWKKFIEENEPSILIKDENWEEYFKKLNPSEFYREIVIDAIVNNKDFAEKYDLNELYLQEVNLNGYVKDIYIKESVIDTVFALTPPGVFKTKEEFPRNFIFTFNQSIFKIGNNGELRRNKDDYGTEYYSQRIINETVVGKIMDKLNKDNYYDFLNDLLVIYENDNYKKDIIEHYISDYKQAFFYHDYVYRSPVTEKVSKLAIKITGKYNSDLEKAYAIENYFLQNGFVYDLEFSKPAGADLDYFLFNSKRGACFDYATSMVLLARSVGIPARYVEGFMVNNQTDMDEDLDVYSVFEKDSHAYPELFISGYGWVMFEPTQVTADGDRGFIFDFNALSWILFITMILIVTIVVINVKFYPQINEFYFRKKLNKTDTSKVMPLILKRIKSKTKIDDFTTTQEIDNIIRKKYDFDLTKTIDLFDKTFYGESDLMDEEKSAVIKSYIEFDEVVKIKDKEEKAMKKLLKKRNKFLDKEI